MKIIIAGGTGFLGKALQGELRRRQHSVAVLTRRATPGSADEISWTPDGTAGAWANALEGCDAIINLAGEGIADKRWTAARKQALIDSRLLTTRSLVAAIRGMKKAPTAFLSGSAIGYYGARGDEPIPESTAPGSGFLPDLCVAWERAAEEAANVTRVVLLRTGLVLHSSGGALKSMLPPFKLGLGGPFGSGQQYMPWIHLDDWVAMTVWALGTAAARGAFNLTAPTPVTNVEFSRTLGRVLHRPAFLPVPGFALRLLLGEFAESLLTGQRVVPAKAEKLGFRFAFSDLEVGLRELVGGESNSSAE